MTTAVHIPSRDLVNQNISAQVQADFVRLVVGGSLTSDSPILDNFPRSNVKYITAAGTSPTSDAATIGKLMTDAGIKAEWIPIYHANCDERAHDPEYVKLIEEADAIYMSGGQSGRLQSCLYGSYSVSGIDRGVATPFLEALRKKSIVGGSSAGAMNQPQSEILITGYSTESYATVRAGEVYKRDAGNRLLETDELVDVHFSERGRQGRLMVLAMQTQQPWAFGVDENTAYIWTNNGEYEVVGAAGVVVFRNVKGDKEMQTGTMHFLTAGDKINRKTGAITFSPDKRECATGEPPARSSSIFSSTNYRAISLAVAKTATGFSLSSYHGSPAIEVAFTKTEDTIAMCGVQGDSFSNLMVVQHQSTAFNNTALPTLPQDYMWEVDS